MSPSADRREFLRAAGLVSFGLTSSLSAAPAPKGEGLAQPIDPNPPPLPTGAIARLGSNRMRASRLVHGFKFSPDGKLIVAADSEFIWGWETATGKVTFRFKYPTTEHPKDGVLTSDGTLALLIFNAANSINKFELCRYTIPDGIAKPPVRINAGTTGNQSISPDARFVSHTDAGRVQIFDGTTGKLLWSGKADPEAFGFFPDGRKLGVGVGNALKVYDSATGKELAELKPPGGGKIGSPVGSPDGNRVAAIADRNNESVTVWAVTTGKPTHTFRTDGKPLAFTPDSRRLITRTPDGAAVWNLATGKKEIALDLGSPGDAIVSPDGKTLAAKSGDAVWLYDAATGNLLPQSADPPGNLTSLRFTPDGRLIGQLTAWGGWATWDRRDSKTKLIRMPKTGALTPAGLSADGKHGLYHHEKSDEFHVRDTATGEVVRKLKAEKAPWYATPDGRTVFLFQGGSAVVLDTTTGQKREIKKGRENPLPKMVGGSANFTMVGLSPDGRLAAEAHNDSSPGSPGASRVILYDLVAGKTSGLFAVEQQVRSVSIAPDGRRIALGLDHRYANSGNSTGTMLVYEVGSPQPLSRIVIENGSDIGSVLAFSPDGRSIAMPTPADKGVTLWETATGKRRHDFEHEGDVHALAFGPDGRTLASSCARGPVLVWDISGHHATAAAPTKTALDRAWEDLASEDAEAAFRAVRLIARHPAQSLPDLAKRVVSRSALDRDRVKKLIAELDNNSFRVREAAQRELTKQIGDVAGELQNALESDPPPEARRRLEALMRRADRLTPDRLRELRLIEAVEWAGTPEAAKLLRLWSAGSHGGGLMIEARRAVERL